MKQGTKLLLAACGLGAAGYAVYRGRKPKKAESIWNLYAPVYNLFMGMDRAMYEEMYRRIRLAIRGRRTLELCTGTGLIAKHVADAASEMVATDFAEKMLAEARKGERPANLTFRQADALTAAGIVFAVAWDAESYVAFLEKNGWRVREKAVLEASIPLVYAECEAKEPEEDGG